MNGMFILTGKTSKFIAAFVFQRERCVAESSANIYDFTDYSNWKIYVVAGNQWSSGHPVVIWSSSGHLVIQWSSGHPVVIWSSIGAYIHVQTHYKPEVVQLAWPDQRTYNVLWRKSRLPRYISLQLYQGLCSIAAVAV